MNASALLRHAIDGPLVHGDVNEAAYPFSARSYLADSSGVAWLIPEALREQGKFALDVEPVAAVRPSLQRRFGLRDPRVFAEAWTRAEVCSKLLDIPIVLWLKQYGLLFDVANIGSDVDAEIALMTRVLADDLEHLVVTFGVLVRP